MITDPQQIRKIVQKVIAAAFAKVTAVTPEELDTLLFFCEMAGLEASFQTSLDAYSVFHQLIKRGREAGYTESEILLAVQDMCILGSREVREQAEKEVSALAVKAASLGPVPTNTNNKVYH